MIKPVAVFCGNLTKDPEMKETKEGLTVANFDIAVNIYNGKEKAVDYYHFVAWRGIAENIGKYLKKGSKVMINSTPHTRAYEDKTGVKRTIVEFTVNDIEFASSGKGGTASDEDSDSSMKTGEAVKTDDLPF